MELTLLPITALLLLLSGAVGPVRLGSDTAETAALLCWLGGESTRASTSPRNSLLHSRLRKQLWDERVHVNALRCASGQHVESRVRKMSRKRFRTRFAAESVTYQAVAPPVA